MRKISSIMSKIAQEMTDYEDFQKAAVEATPAVQELLDLPDLLTYGVQRQGFHVDSSSWLRYDPDISITIASVKAGAKIPTHNHGTWEIVAPYRGSLSYIGYERVDDGARPGFAELRPSDRRPLNQGDIAVCPPPPHDVHGWTVETDTYLLAVVGPDISTRRQYYTPDQNSYLEKEAMWPRLLG
jgi:predicted metal-dependent enzyme (double-stranded beta helix superfamily)